MSSTDLLHSKNAYLSAWHSCGTSFSCRHCSGVFLRRVQQSVCSRQRLRSTRRPEQGRPSGLESEEDVVESEEDIDRSIKPQTWQWHAESQNRYREVDDGGTQPLNADFPSDDSGRLESGVRSRFRVFKCGRDSTRVTQHRLNTDTDTVTTDEMNVDLSNRLFLFLCDFFGRHSTPDLPQPSDITKST